MRLLNKIIQAHCNHVFNFPYLVNIKRGTITCKRFTWFRQWRFIWLSLHLNKVAAVKTKNMTMIRFCSMTRRQNLAHILFWQIQCCRKIKMIMEFAYRYTTIFIIRHLWHVGFKEKHILVTTQIASDVQTVNVRHYFPKKKRKNNAKDNEVDDIRVTCRTLITI